MYNTTENDTKQKMQYANSNYVSVTGKIVGSSESEAEQMTTVSSRIEIVPHTMNVMSRSADNRGMCQLIFIAFHNELLSLREKISDEYGVYAYVRGNATVWSRWQIDPSHETQNIKTFQRVRLKVCRTVFCSAEGGSSMESITMRNVFALNIISA